MCGGVGVGCDDGLTLERVTSAAGTVVSYDKTGTGPPLVLVHGAFSDHRTNWELVRPMLRERFTLYAIARRGRGDTDVTIGHRLQDEAADVVALIEAVGEPVFLLGHSYGAHCALAAALRAPERVRRLVLYEPPLPAVASAPALARLERLAAGHAWDDFAATFFRDQLMVPAAEIDALRATPLWSPIVADAPASLGDLRALNACRFDAAACRRLTVPVLLQIGTESPRQLYVTDALAESLPNVRIGELTGQAHEGMTTAPEMYAEAVTRYLLG